MDPSADFTSVLKVTWCLLVLGIIWLQVADRPANDMLRVERNNKRHKGRRQCNKNVSVLADKIPDRTNWPGKSGGRDVRGSQEARANVQPGYTAVSRYGHILGTRDTGCFKCHICAHKLTVFETCKSSSSAPGGRGGRVKIVISDAAMGHTSVDIVVADPTRRDLVERAARDDLVAATHAE